MTGDQKSLSASVRWAGDRARLLHRLSQTDQRVQQAPDPTSGHARREPRRGGTSRHPQGRGHGATARPLDTARVAWRVDRRSGPRPRQACRFGRPRSSARLGSGLWPCASAPRRRPPPAWSALSQSWAWSRRAQRPTRSRLSTPPPSDPTPQTPPASRAAIAHAAAAQRTEQPAPPGPPRDPGRLPSPPSVCLLLPIHSLGHPCFPPSDPTHLAPTRLGPAKSVVPGRRLSTALQSCLWLCRTWTPRPRRPSMLPLLPP